MIARTVTARAVASVILVGGLVLGTSGCTFMTTQATLIRYDPSDGISATIGDLAVRNVLALISDDGRALSLLITVVNTGRNGASLSLQYDSGGTKTSDSRYVNGNSVASFGNVVGERQIIVANPGVKAGALFPLYLQSGDQPGQRLLVPVLNADLPQYATLKPTPHP